MRVDYHAAAMPGDLTCKGKVVRIGGQFSTAEAHVYDEDGKLARERPRHLFHRAAAAPEGVSAPGVVIVLLWKLEVPRLLKLPPPLWGRVRERGVSSHAESAATPLPVPPPQGGGNVAASEACHTSACFASKQQ